MTNEQRESEKETRREKAQARGSSRRYTARRSFWAKTGHVATLTEGEILWNASEI